MLTKEEIKFLKDHKFSEHDVLDARNMSKPEYKEQSKKQKKPIILGSSCKAGGHRLRTGNGGHCVQCDTSKIAYSRRYSKSGYVYISGSLEKNGLK